MFIVITNAASPVNIYFCQTFKITVSLIFITTLKSTCYKPYFLECQEFQITKFPTVGNWQNQNVSPGLPDSKFSVTSVAHAIFSMMLVVIWKAQQDPFLYILWDTCPTKIKQVIFFLLFAQSILYFRDSNETVFYNTFGTVMTPAVINLKALHL